MNTDTVVTIGREYGSGGREIGRLLARELKVPFYDKEILTRAAQKSGIGESLFEQHDEKTTPSYLFSMTGGLDVPVDSPGYGMSMSLNHRIFLAQFEAITQLASEGPCIIVGRCADYVLKERPNTLRFFLYASTEARIERIMALEQTTYQQAKERVRKTDKQRQHYYNFFAEGNWGHRLNYDLMLRTDVLTIPTAVQALQAYIAQAAASQL